MSYQVIARKWRPQTFGDLVGQAHVTETLQNAIRNNRVAHAYIFSGARGVGKTTAARILAKALNCVNGPTAEPCGVCDSCKEIAAGSSLDVIEIDAASNRGIDQIRELREMVRYAPAASRSKVVILDEAQNTTSMQMKMFLTRLGENSRMIVTGDPSQVDLPPGQRSGLAEAIRLLRNVEGIAIITYTAEDIIRHELVARIVDAYDKERRKAARARERYE